MPLLHTPYTGRAQPFSIGLRPILPALWLVADDQKLPQLVEKNELLHSNTNVVVRERHDTRIAQAELLGMVVEHLQLVPASLEPPADPEEPPIVTASRFIQDDLVLMRRDDDGWRLVAACLCFPSNWSLAEKFDQPMETIHEAVPGFAGQMANRINRIFDHLPTDQIVERFNWSINHDDLLHHPEPKSGPRPWRSSTEPIFDHAFVRVERQTLRRLPVSQDIVFTIKVHVDPISAFRVHPEGKTLARALCDQLAHLTPEQLAYKNVLAHRDLLIDALSGLADV